MHLKAFSCTTLLAFIKLQKILQSILKKRIFYEKYYKNDIFGIIIKLF